MRPVAIGAHGGFFRSVGYSLSMNTFLISREGVGPSGNFRDKLLVVAGAASGGNVGVVRL